MIVLKFGGAALRDLAQFQKVAMIIVQKRERYDKVIVVVSAMGTMTDELLGMAKQISVNPPKREQDMLISVGERISMALLAMALQERGCQAMSFTGSQAGIITCSEHTDAKVIQVKPRRILPHLDEGKVVIVAGFQGVSESGEITTLGRGGSDTTAVALAVALKAKRVEFYKDVKGIFLNDPKHNPAAEYISELTYEEALKVIEREERKVLHPRAVRLAEKNKIPLFVRSFDEMSEGSRIGIPRGIQELANSESGAQDFDQAKPALKQGLCEHRSDARGSKDWDAGTGSGQFLDHERDREEGGLLEPQYEV